MADHDGTTADVRETLTAEIAEQRTAAEAERDPEARARRLESVALRAELAGEEAAAISAEIA